MLGIRVKGFTLIELLVVIAIIAILAAILFPVFASVMESGRAAKCAASMSNISRALIMYRDDYNGRNCYIFGAAGGPANGYDHSSFYFALGKYAGQKLQRFSDGVSNKDFDTIYKCPSAPWLRAKLNTGSGRKNEGFAFTMNETGWYDTSVNKGLWAGNRLYDAQFRRPSQTIFVAECIGWQGCGVGYGLGGIIDNAANNPNSIYERSKDPLPDEDIPLSDGITGRNGGSRSKVYNIRVSHNLGCNCLFYDGHVKRMTRTKGYNWSVYY